MDWLKEILQDEALVSKVTQELGKHFIPKDQYNKKINDLQTVTDEYSTFKKSQEQTTRELESLKTKAQLADEYKGKYEQLETTVQTLKSDSDKQVSRIKKEYLLERKLIANKAVEDGIDLLKKEFDVDALELDGDDFKNWDEAFAPVRDKRKSFFYAEKVEGQAPKVGDAPTKSLKDMSVEEFAKASGIKGITG